MNKNFGKRKYEVVNNQRFKIREYFLTIQTFL